MSCEGDALCSVAWSALFTIQSFIIGVLTYTWLKNNSHRFKKCRICKKWIGLLNPSFCGIVRRDGTKTVFHHKCLKDDNIRNYMEE